MIGCFKDVDGKSSYLFVERKVLYGSVLNFVSLWQCGFFLHYIFNLEYDLKLPNLFLDCPFEKLRKCLLNSLFPVMFNFYNGLTFTLSDIHLLLIYFCNVHTDLLPFVLNLPTSSLRILFQCTHCNIPDSNLLIFSHQFRIIFTCHAHFS